VQGWVGVKIPGLFIHGGASKFDGFGDGSIATMIFPELCVWCVCVVKRLWLQKCPSGEKRSFLTISTEILSANLCGPS